MSAITYNRIRSLSSSILAEGSVVKRRASAKELVEQLGNVETRRRLAVGGTPPRGSVSNLQAARHEALSNLWRLVIQSALRYVEAILFKKKTKLSRDDVCIPIKLVKLCHTYDAGIDYIKDNRKEYPRTRLSRKGTKSVIKFCLELLDHIWEPE